MRKESLAFFLVSISILVLIFTSPALAENQASKKELSFGTSYNLSPLIRGESLQNLQKTTFTRGYAAQSGGISISKSLNINISDCSLRRVRDFDSIKIKSTVPLGKPGEPELPAKIAVYTFPKDVRIRSVEVIGGTYAPILNKLRIAPAPQPTRKGTIPQPKGGLIPDKAIYSSENYFPGKIFTYETGKDNQNTYLYLRFYPVQYIPKTGEAFLITDVSFNIYYEETE